MADSVVAQQSVAAEAVWHYVQEGQTKGPIPQSDVARMLSEGRLAADAPLWTEGMPDWTPANQIHTFQTNLPSMPLVAPQAAAQPTLRQRADRARAEGIPQIRPWVRYFARACDIWIFAIVVGLVLGMAGLAEGVPEWAFGMVIPFLWLFVEAGLLSSWGTTPGKCLLGTWVADKMGNRLSYGEALSRSFSVWFMGLGFGLPVVSLVTLISSFVKLRRDGITAWDRDGQCAVIHERIGVGRVVAVIALMVAFGVLVALATLAEAA
jgi:uncharacterized RDD family membrane protein YckC